MSSAAPIDDLKIGLWSVNFAHRVAGPEAWVELVGARMEEVRAAAGQLLVLPEYVSGHWLHWAQRQQSGIGFMQWMADQGQAILPRLEALVRKTGIGLVAGSMPHRLGVAATLNRCWILLPDGKGGIRRGAHDKLVATPPERPDGDWPIACGRTLSIVEWRGLRFAFLICLDVEMPAIAARLGDEAIDVIIVPSMTGALSGYHRVFDCAKARAIELFTSVAVVGGIGTLPWDMGANCAGGAVFVPCEQELGSTGRIASVGPLDAAEGPGPLLLATIPVGQIRRLRAEGPEAWPGPFTADGIEFQRREAAS